MIITVAALSAGALPPHMMPPALNPFGLGAPPPQSLSRDNMPLPYGEHHLMQVIYQHKHASGARGQCCIQTKKASTFDQMHLQAQIRTLPWRTHDTVCILNRAEA